MISTFDLPKFWRDPSRNLFEVSIPQTSLNDISPYLAPRKIPFATDQQKFDGGQETILLFSAVILSEGFI